MKDMSIQMQYYDPDERTPVDLTAGEMREYQEQVAIIRENRKGPKAFYRVGVALKWIKEWKLYQQDYSTFEEFCDGCLGISRTHANRLVAASNVVENIALMGLISPVNEAQARPLTKLEKYGEAAQRLQRKAWQIAVEKAKTLSSGITARVVEEAVEQVMGSGALPPGKERQDAGPGSD